MYGLGLSLPDLGCALESHGFWIVVVDDALDDLVTISDRTGVALYGPLLSRREGFLSGWRLNQALGILLVVGEGLGGILVVASSRKQRRRPVSVVVPVGKSLLILF